MDYKDTDKAIEKLQQDIEKIQSEISALRSNRELELFEDYTLYHRDASAVLLSSLFKDQDELLLIHNMGKSCSYCTMWADTLNSSTTIINDRVPMVLISPNEPSVLDTFASSRNWNFLCVSAHGTNFISDSGYSYEKEGKTYYMPGVSAFVKKEGKIYRTNKDYFGPGDVYCSPWHFFDLLSKKDNGWTPKFDYLQKA